jgi:hypothetical protein
VEFVADFKAKNKMQQINAFGQLTVDTGLTLHFDIYSSLIPKDDRKNFSGRLDKNIIHPWSLHFLICIFLLSPVITNKYEKYDSLTQILNIISSFD